MNEFWLKRSISEKALIFFALITGLRFIFAYTVPLIDDEAYHWSWTLNLQLSYFDHPAMVAWLETLSLKLLGETYIGVRLPFFICYTLTVWMSWKLASELFDKITANFVGLILLFSPFYGFGGYVASPEPPFILCWVLAAWVFWQGHHEDEHEWSVKKTWIWLGILMGLGLNSKFIMAMLAPGFGLYMLLSKKHRRDFLTPWPWVGVLIASIICLPIFWWNILHDWPGFKFQFSDRHAGQDPSFSRWLGFIGAQIGFYTPILYGLMLFALYYSFKKISEARWRFVFSMAIPSFVLFYIQPYFADYKPHWSGPAAIFLVMAAGYFYSQGIQLGDKTLLVPRSRFYRWGLLAFLVPINILIYTPFIYPWMPKAHAILAPNKEWKTTYDLSNEFYGWEELGAYVNRRQREIHAETGTRPFIASHRYETTAQTTWGTKQKVYMLNTTISQYTVMQTEEEIKSLLGMNALFVMSEKYHAKLERYAQFDRCTPEELKTYRHGIHARTFYIYYCENFKGITL
ncbi:MAG: ArnT family glycosyltransferase [Bdellovibrionia bacterium]